MVSAPFPALGHVPYGQPDPDIRRSRSVVYYLRANLVFVTAYCRPILTDTTLNFCQHLMRIACTDMAQTCVSSGRLRQQYPAEVPKYLWGKRFWSPPKFAASCAGALLTIIKQYVDQQNQPD